MQSATQRIAKNTLMLYFRQILIMLVSLYTVRVVLNTLGAEDYGIYNVVAGVVTMFGFLSGSMASASQRFFSYEIGRGNFEQLNRTFCITVFIYIGISLIVILFAETIGLWFLKNEINIPHDRRKAAFFVYQFSMLAFVVTVLAIPYNASIFAHEHVFVFAYISIFDVVCRLVVASILKFVPFDKLTFYAFLTTGSTICISLLYFIYCKKKYKECRFRFCWDKKLLFSIFSYSNWNMIGAIANIARTQGINLLLNIFIGPIVNTARAVSYQIQGALSLLATNIYATTRTQITKYYAQYETEAMWDLVFQSTKFSYYIFLILAIPFFFEIEYIFTLWLGNIPEYAPTITRLVLIGFMLEAMTNQLVGVLQAANKLKEVQLISSSILLLNIPVSYMFLCLGFSPYMPFAASILISILYMISEIIITKIKINLPAKRFIRETAKLLGVTLMAFIAPCFIYIGMDRGTLRFIALTGMSLVITAFFIFTFGLARTERIVICNFIKNKVSWYINQK